jgi:hypothetical protein
LVDYKTFSTFSRHSANQSEDAKYNKIDGNDVIQQPRDKENQDSRD